tara:strand:+ start:82 stop:1002 length:921 start_codon:yes stop_codon:yes gene_type:complete
MAGSAGGIRSAPLAPQGNFNVNQAAAGGLQQAMQGTQQAMAGPNIGQFMNPYTSMVTGQTLGDLERQRQMAVNTTGAQATQAGAFGGSRHGVAEALTNEGFARQGAQTFGNLQQQGFNTALGAAQAQQGLQMGGAAQLGQLGQQAFNTGQAISQQQMQQGLMQQGMQQALIDAARGQYAGFTGAPQQALSLPLAALGAQPNQSTTTQQKNPGLFDYLSLAASTAAQAAAAMSDVRLKTNIKHLGKENGINVYSWDWNEDGKRIADPKQPTVGVMAQELQETHPHLVELGSDGFLRVNYGGLAAEVA